MYATNLMTNALKQEQIEALMSILYDNINSDEATHTWAILLELVGGRHLALTGVGQSDTSFFHHDKMHLFQFSGLGFGDHMEDGIPLLCGFKDNFTSHLVNGNWGMYANYVGTELDSETAQKMCWGGNLARLQQSKAELDPDDVFWNPQGIRPADDDNV